MQTVTGAITLFELPSHSFVVVVFLSLKGILPFPLSIRRCGLYEGRAKSSVTNRLPKFYPRYILKCFTALEWCVE